VFQKWEARIMALERMVDREALEIELLKEGLKHARRPISANTSVCHWFHGISVSREWELMELKRLIPGSA